MYANYEKLNEITALYKGPVYDYWDYDRLVTGMKVLPFKKEKNWLKKYKPKRRTVFTKTSLISKSNY